jgi:hypothetical protein
MAVGTSAVVEPAASFVAQVGGHARTIYVGPEEPANLSAFTECHFGKRVSFCPTYSLEGVRRSSLLQLRVLGFGCLQDGDVGVVTATALLSSANRNSEDRNECCPTPAQP